MANQLNSAGESHASSLIASGKVDTSSSWSMSADDENKILGDPPNWTEYGSWHLGKDAAEKEDTKGHWKYPFGKNGKVYRSALIAIRGRAGQQGDTSIGDAAKSLLDKIDKKKSDVAKTPRAWYRFAFNSAKPEEADLYVYDEIGDSFFGESTVTAKKFIADLNEMPEGVSKLRVHVNSPGGSVFDAVAIANALKAHRAQVDVMIEGLAASAATIVTMAGDRIAIADNALMMIHDPFGFVIGTADDCRKEAEALDRVRDSIVATYRWHSNLEPKQLQQMMAESTWMDAEEAVSYGFATEIVKGMKAAAHFSPGALAKLGTPPAAKYVNLLGGILEGQTMAKNPEGTTVQDPPAPAAPANPPVKVFKDMTEPCPMADCGHMAAHPCSAENCSCNGMVGKAAPAGGDGDGDADDKGKGKQTIVEQTGGMGGDKLPESIRAILDLPEKSTVNDAVAAIMKLKEPKAEDPAAAEEVKFLKASARVKHFLAEGKFSAKEAEIRPGEPADKQGFAMQMALANPDAFELYAKQKAPVVPIDKKPPVQPPNTTIVNGAPLPAITPEDEKAMEILGISSRDKFIEARQVEQKRATATAENE